MKFMTIKLVIYIYFVVISYACYTWLIVRLIVMDVDYYYTCISILYIIIHFATLQLCVHVFSCHAQAFYMQYS